MVKFQLQNDLFYFKLGSKSQTFDFEKFDWMTVQINICVFEVELANLRNNKIFE